MMKLCSVAAACCLIAGLSSMAVADESAPAPEQPAASLAEPAPAASTAPAAENAPAAPASTAESTASTAAPADQTAEEDPIICKMVHVTGSRVRKEKTCRPKSAWEKTSEEAQRMMRNVDRKSTPGVGGQNLPIGN